MTQSRIRASSYNERLKKQKRKCPFLQLLLFNSGNKLRYCTAKENPEDANYLGMESQRKGVSSRQGYYPKNFQLTSFPYKFSSPSQFVHDADRFKTGFSIALSSSREIMPRCEGSSSIILATKYPAMDQVWNFLACLPTYRPSFPS